AWIIETPFGYCGVATMRPMIARPLAVVVTGLEHEVELPRAMPPVDTSSCFQTILFGAGLRATSRLTVSAFGGVDVRSWMIAPDELITGCWSAAGGASMPKLVTFAHTTSVPVCGSNDGSGHSTPPRKVGVDTTYCWSVYVGNAVVGTTYGLPSGASRPW